MDVGVGGADQEVVLAVEVEVADAGQGVAELVAGRRAVDRVDVGAAGAVVDAHRAGAQAVAGLGRSHGEVRVAVAVGVADDGHRAAELVVGGDAAEGVERGAAGPGQDPDVTGSAREHLGGADDEVGHAVPAEVAAAGDRAAEAVAGGVAEGGEEQRRGGARVGVDRPGRAAVAVLLVGADDEVGEPVVVEVAGRRGGDAEAVERGAADERVQQAAVDAGVDPRVAVAAAAVGGLGSRHQEVAEAVAVEVAEAADRAAEVVADAVAVDRAQQAAVPARVDPGAAGRPASAVVERGADDQVAETVAVDVAGGGHRAAEAGADRGAQEGVEADPAQPRIDRRAAGELSGGVVAVGADHDLPDAVAVEVARGIHRAPGVVLGRAAGEGVDRILRHQPRGEQDHDGGSQQRGRDIDHDRTLRGGRRQARRRGLHPRPKRRHCAPIYQDRSARDRSHPGRPAARRRLQGLAEVLQLDPPQGAAELDPQDAPQDQGVGRGLGQPGAPGVEGLGPAVGGRGGQLAVLGVERHPDLAAAVEGEDAGEGGVLLDVGAAPEDQPVIVRAVVVGVDPLRALAGGGEDRGQGDEEQEEA